MLGADPEGHDGPPQSYSPRIQAAWDHYCAVSAGSVAGGVDHWDQVPGWAKADCLRATRLWWEDRPDLGTGGIYARE